jgi:hypothetical protein
MGMWDEGHNEFLNEAPPHGLTFVFNTTINIPSEFISQEEVILLRCGGMS